jgi:hypothetical protein
VYRGGGGYLGWLVAACVGGAAGEGTKRQGWWLGMRGGNGALERRLEGGGDELRFKTIGGTHGMAQKGSCVSATLRKSRRVT